MKKDYGNAHFFTIPVSDPDKGYSGFELYRIENGVKNRVARVIFWDAAGQFYFEIFNAELPVNLVEELIARQKQLLILNNQATNSLAVAPVSGAAL